MYIAEVLAVEVLGVTHLVSPPNSQGKRGIQIYRDNIIQHGLLVEKDEISV